jgi:hypothetical protein
LFPSLQAGVRCFEDKDDEQRLIETVLFLGLEWLFPIWSLKFLNHCIQTPGLLIFKIYPP